MTRALFVSHTAQKGGAELFLCDLVAGSMDDWRARFLSDGPAAAELLEVGADVRVIAAGKRMLALRKGAPIGALVRSSAEVVAAGRALAAEARDVEVIWANSQKALFACSIAALLARKPLVWCLHDILLDGQFSAASRRAAIAASRLCATLVAVNSRATADAFVAAGGEHGKVRIVPNGFANTPAPPCRGWLRRDLGVGGKPLIGMFGRLSEWKGQHVLIDAIARQPGLHAVIVGAALFGECDYERSLRYQCESLGIADRVHFLGFRDDLPAIMAELDLVVHCSTIPEPFGRVVAEAMAASRPVIATRGGGIEELVIHDVTGTLVPPGDCAALRNAICDLLADRLRAKRLAERGRKHVFANFSLANSRRATSAVLLEAAGGRRHGSAQIFPMPMPRPEKVRMAR